MHIISILLVCLISGCASNRYAGLAHHAAAPASLAVTPATEQVPQTRVTEYRDEGGRSVGSAETIVGYRTVVTGFLLKRGDAVIDEQDYYELAGDRDAVDLVKRARARGRLMNTAGIATLIAGTAAAIAVPIVVGRSAAPYAVTQWFVSFPVGLALTLFGKARFEKHQLPVTRAFAAIGRAPAPWAEQLD